MVEIGNWVKRATGKWHLVDSVVSKRVVTRCGKEMEFATPRRGALEVLDVEPLTRGIDQPQLCHGGCS